MAVPLGDRYVVVGASCHKFKYLLAVLQVLGIASMESFRSELVLMLAIGDAD